MVAFLCAGPLLAGPCVGYVAWAVLEWRDDRRAARDLPPG